MKETPKRANRENRYYTQESVDMDENLRMIEYIRETADSIALKDGSFISAAQMLERFLFPMGSHGTPIRKLSGGEKRRLYLLNILMSAPNVLLLDEPTNDLDTQTLTVLEDYLETFSGVVITVSHDRYLWIRRAISFLFSRIKLKLISITAVIQSSWKKRLKRPCQ